MHSYGASFLVFRSFYKKGRISQHIQLTPGCRSLYKKNLPRAKRPEITVQRHDMGFCVHISKYTVFELKSEFQKFSFFPISFLVTMYASRL